MKQERPYPRVTVTRKAARALAGGHPWVFEGEVIAAEPAENGAIVDVFEENGTWQGAGLLSLESKIRVRVGRTTMGDRGLPGAEPDTTCCRVVFSEADGMPGLVADRYENVLVMQVGTVGMERLRPVVYRALVAALAADGEKIDAIYERNDGASRAKEGLPQYKGWWDGLPAPETARLMVRENGLRFDLDIENSQKTGFFLDQKYNRRAVREIAAGRRVLDCFCHVGPFGLNAAAGGAEFVRCVDVSDTAIELARENARLNGLDARMDFTCANVLDYLPELARDRARLREEGGPFDLIVLDPPAFTKSRGTVSHAARGYREINYQALRLLPRGGYLATCSCSHFMTRDLLAKAIAEAAHQANVQLKQGPRPPHPLGLPREPLPGLLRLPGGLAAPVRRVSRPTAPSRVIDLVLD